MVTEAGKELLRNTINTAKFHNRILEENEMWKQWEIERGLTMMVSDDVILSKSARKHHHQCSKHRSKTKSTSRERTVKVNRNVSAPGSSRDVIDRWDHNGFRELYPDEADHRETYKPVARDNEKKWDHSGFLELYPEEALKVKQASTSTSKEHSKKEKKKKRKHHSKASSSDNEIWEEFKIYKRSKAGKKSKSYDSHVKEWKKQSKRERKS